MTGLASVEIPGFVLLQRLVGGDYDGIALPAGYRTGGPRVCVLPMSTISWHEALEQQHNPYLFGPCPSSEPKIEVPLPCPRIPEYRLTFGRWAVHTYPPYTDWEGVPRRLRPSELIRGYAAYVDVSVGYQESQRLLWEAFGMREEKR